MSSRPHPHSNLPHPTCISIDAKLPLESFFKTQTQSILPPFPQWEKSFISGAQGLLLKIEHAIETPSSSASYAPTWAKINFTDRAEGPPKHVHGGVSAGLIDELMGILVWHHGLMSVTQNLELFYWRPLPLHQVCYGISEITSLNERTVEARTTLFVDELPHVSARAVFHRLSLEQLEKFRKSKNIA